MTTNLKDFIDNVKENIDLDEPVSDTIQKAMDSLINLPKNHVEVSAIKDMYWNLSCVRDAFKKQEETRQEEANIESSPAQQTDLLLREITVIMSKIENLLKTKS